MKRSTTSSTCTMFAMRRWLLALALMFSAGPLQAQTGAATASLQAIASLDVPRYLGRWYEIAKFPNRFQQQCVADTSADYSLLPDGSLQVLNQCRRSNGEMQQALGAARQVGGGNSARLQVRFAPAWLSLLPFVWGDYWVIDLDADYQLVAVSEPRREYLWILSRSQKPDPARYAALLDRLRGMGFSLERLEITRQGPAS
jgi:apolipoprotein D and lipocalin family protein